MLCVPRTPYLPPGTLREVLAYPSPVASFDAGVFAHVLDRLAVDQLVPLLDQVRRWDQELSDAEQQCLAFARALLHAPPWLLIDEALETLHEDTFSGSARFSAPSSRTPASFTSGVASCRAIYSPACCIWSRGPRRAGSPHRGHFAHRRLPAPPLGRPRSESPAPQQSLLRVRYVLRRSAARGWGLSRCAAISRHTARAAMLTSVHHSMQLDSRITGRPSME